MQIVPSPDAALKALATNLQADDSGHISRLDAPLEEKILSYLTLRELGCVAGVSRSLRQAADGLRQPHPAALTHTRAAMAKGVPDFKALIPGRESIEANLASQLDRRNFQNPLSCPEAAATLRTQYRLTRENALSPHLWLEQTSLSPMHVTHVNASDAERAIAAFAQTSQQWRTSDVGRANVAAALSATQQPEDALHYATLLLQMLRQSAEGSADQLRRKALLRWVCSTLLAPEFLATLAASPLTAACLHAPSLLASAAHGGSVAQARLALSLMQGAEPAVRRAAASQAWDAYTWSGVTNSDTPKILDMMEELAHMQDGAVAPAVMQTPAEATEHVLRAASHRNIAAITLLHARGVQMPTVAQAIQQHHTTRGKIVLANLWLDLNVPMSTEAAVQVRLLAVTAGNGPLLRRLLAAAPRLPRLEADAANSYELKTCLSKGTRETLTWLQREQPRFLGPLQADMYDHCIDFANNAEAFTFLREQGVPLTKVHAAELVEKAINARCYMLGSWSASNTGREDAAAMFGIVERLEVDAGLDFAGDDRFVRYAIGHGDAEGLRWFMKRYAQHFSNDVLSDALDTQNLSTVRSILDHGVDDANADSGTRARLLEKTSSFGAAAREAYDLLSRRGYVSEKAQEQVDEMETRAEQIGEICRTM